KQCLCVYIIVSYATLSLLIRKTAIKLNTDIKVVCGTKYMDLDIYICPVYQALYNESLMVLNGQINNPECYGTPDWNATPPLLKFRFPINATSGKSFLFADFSNVQYVNISGTVVSIDPSAGTITYRRQIMYKFSCKYPMQYLLNNTEVAVLAIRDNNGSFISTLSMALYRDANYKDLLIVPETGLSLKTKIYVAVHATNLTENFHVLLDRCFATTKPEPFNSTHHDLFVGCTFDGQTRVEMNGKGQKAYFSFEAFRFVEHKNLTISTFYVHCAVRLCKDEDCENLSVSPQKCSLHPEGPQFSEQVESALTFLIKCIGVCIHNQEVSVLAEIHHQFLGFHRIDLEAVQQHQSTKSRLSSLYSSSPPSVMRPTMAESSENF
uniref:Si:dkey-4p15.5 n=1 Tax=Amphiprion percula TaxID=161767 RepID=A0A3P8SDS2_AMPPE